MTIRAIAAPYIRLAPGRYFITDPSYVEDELEKLETYNLIPLWDDGAARWKDIDEKYELVVESGELALIDTEGPLLDTFSVKQHDGYLEINVPTGPCPCWIQLLGTNLAPKVSRHRHSLNLFYEKEEVFVFRMPELAEGTAHDFILCKEIDCVMPKGTYHFHVYDREISDRVHARVDVTEPTHMEQIATLASKQLRAVIHNPRIHFVEKVYEVEPNVYEMGLGT